MLVFLDTEFTNLLDPQLLSLGLVTLDGREHYGELDLASEVGKARVKASSNFVRYTGDVLDQWGRVPGAVGTEWEVGRRAGEWLLGLAAETGELVEVAYNFAADFELLERAVHNCGLFDAVRGAVMPVNVDAVTGNINGELAAEACYRALAPRGIGRHHALADALALRAAYRLVKDVALRMARLTHSGDFHRLRQATSLGEAWLRGWLVSEQVALGQRRPLDVLDEPHGVERLVTYCSRLNTGCICNDDRHAGPVARKSHERTGRLTLPDPVP